MHLKEVVAKSQPQLIKIIFYESFKKFRSTYLVSVNLNVFFKNYFKFDFKISYKIGQFDALSLHSETLLIRSTFLPSHVSPQDAPWHELLLLQTLPAATTQLLPVTSSVAVS